MLNSPYVKDASALIKILIIYVEISFNSVIT